MASDERQRSARELELYIAMRVRTCSGARGCVLLRAFCLESIAGFRWRECAGREIELLTLTSDPSLKSKSVAVNNVVLEVKLRGEVKEEG